MAFHEIETQWMGKMQFNALVNGHTLVMDAPARVGGEDNGPIPKPFVLTALSGCTGMDVVKLLLQSGVVPDDLSLKVHGTLGKGQPMTYVAIHVVYEIRGAAEHCQAALDAVTQSQEAICGVSSLLKKALPVTWEVVYNGARLFCNKPEDEAAFV